MSICPTCGSQNEAMATFCDQCGTPLAAKAPTPGATPAFTPAVAPPSAGNLCPSCGTPVMPGEAFCDSCGAALSPGSSAVTPSPVMPPVAAVVQPVYTPPVAVAPPPVRPVAATAQILTNGGQSFPLSGKATYLLGREDAVSGIYPDVDTTGTGGEASGVSRRHAEILQQGAQWLIRDLGSTNGTFVNNQRLAANAQQRLNSGDQIRLGTWAGKFQA